MAASLNLPQSPISRKSSISKSGVLTLSGFGVRVHLQNGHLEIEDGVGLQRRNFRLSRVNHGLKRLVCISDDGYVSLSALKWLADIGASFVLLDRKGKALLVTGPTAASDSRLRRSQALALGSGIGLAISRTLIDAKLEGQERVLQQQLSDSVAAQAVAQFREKLPSVDTFDKLRVLEAHAAGAYFEAWHDVPVIWPKQDVRRIPAHWCTAGSRRSPLTGGPRLAVTPVHALLNYCFALLESETRMAVCALGLDAGLGLGLHTDTPNRDSLVFDVLEPIRPKVESWVLNWIKHEPLSKADFFETETGNCRLRSTLCAKLSETAPTWGKLVAPWAEYVARALWESTSPAKSERRLSTPLTQRHRRLAKGRPALPEIKTLRPERLCRGCGNAIRRDTTHCAECAAEIRNKSFLDVAKVGRIAGHTPEAIAKEAATHRKHAAARRSWKPENQPAWLTDQFYRESIQPPLSEASAAAIAKRLGVSVWYAGQIRKGYRPHPRHWLALVELVGTRSSQCV